MLITENTLMLPFLVGKYQVFKVVISVKIFSHQNFASYNIFMRVNHVVYFGSKDKLDIQIYTIINIIIMINIKLN